MAYGFVNAGTKNPIDDEKIEKTSTWSSEKVNTALAEKLGHNGNASDLNSTMTPGIYTVNNNTSGMPEDVPQGLMGSLLVMPGVVGQNPSAWRAQILTGMSMNGMGPYQYYRTFDDVHGGWTGWAKIPLGKDVENLQSRVENMTTLLDTSVAAREDITASKLSDLNITKSGIYNVSISKSFSIDGTTDIHNGGGLLIVFGRNDHSALQFWLLLDNTSRTVKFYWRFLQTEGDDGEGYILPGTKFVSV